MARIAGVDLPRDKRVEIGLTYIFGIGLKTAQKILAVTGVNPDTRVKDLSEADTQKLRREIEDNHKVEGDLRREISMNIKRLIDIGFPSEASAQRLTQEPAKVPEGQLRTRKWRRSKGGNEDWLREHHRHAKENAAKRRTLTTVLRIFTLRSTTRLCA